MLWFIKITLEGHILTNSLLSCASTAPALRPRRRRRNDFELETLSFFIEPSYREGSKTFKLSLQPQYYVYDLFFVKRKSRVLTLY
jgi:hypothetical protein